MSLNGGLNYLMQKVRVTQDLFETIHQRAIWELPDKLQLSQSSPFPPKVAWVG